MDYNEAQSSMVGGVNFLNDPFLDAGSGAISPAVQKSNKPDSSCVSNGALAGSIIGTLLLSALIAFLTWLVYIRPKFQGLLCCFSPLSHVVFRIHRALLQANGMGQLQTGDRTAVSAVRPAHLVDSRSETASR